MKFVATLLLAAASVYAARETIQEAAVHARKLLHAESVMTLTSIFDPDVNPTLAGQPFALTEYYADCSDDGTPTLLLMDLEITTRNMKHGSPMSACIDSTAPNGTYSKASLPRMNLNGVMSKIEDKKEEQEALKCYLKRHPDAHEWTPDNPDAPHRASWYQFHVESVYYFGGFGNVSFIGFLPIDLYRSVDLSKDNRFIAQQLLPS